MISNTNIPVRKVKESRLATISLENLPFGKYFTDHMLVAEYKNGEWGNVEIRPYDQMSVSPSISALHYGQAIFEGIKAYKLASGETAIFRPEENFRRFNKSAERMSMPAVPAHVFMDGLLQLVALDSGWIPGLPDHSLYIRPFMFASDEALGVKPSDSYIFMIILSPTGPYYAAPMRIFVEEQYVRAAPGGVGFAKAAGNYASALYATAQAKKTGFDQVLWLDAIEHKYVQEIGVMNVFFVIGDRVITPGLEEGTILEGVTRASAITILSDMGLTVEQRPLSMDEVVDAHANGTLREIFGTGTAATISFIKELKYKDLDMHFDVDAWVVAPELKKRLNNLRMGIDPDSYGWLVTV